MSTSPGLRLPFNSLFSRAKEMKPSLIYKKTAGLTRHIASPLMKVSECSGWWKRPQLTSHLSGLAPVQRKPFSLHTGEEERSKSSICDVQEGAMESVGPGKSFQALRARDDG